MDRPRDARKHNGILICGPWPHPRIAIFELLRSLIASLNGRGWPIVYLCEAFGVRALLGPDAVCVLDFPTENEFEWRSAFSRKLIYPSLTAFLAEDRCRFPGLLDNVAILHAHLDKLVFASDHPTNSKNFERTLSDYIVSRTGRIPLLIRTHHDDMQGNLDGFMRLTGIDYVSLNRSEREAILRDAVDLRPTVREHVAHHRNQMRSWGWGETFLDEAIHHAWWRLHQLFRWRYELDRFDAVVCLTGRGVEDTRELLKCEGRLNLTSIHNATPFQPTNREQIDHLLHEYHHRNGLECYRGGAGHLAPIPFHPEDRKVVFVGRAAREKGCFELVESLRNLYHSGRRNIRGIFVGGFGQELRRALASVDPAHAGDYLLFPGLIEDVDVLASLFAFGDVTAIPSHYDSFCLVGLESYQMGTPCVVTEGTGAGEAYLNNPRRHGVEIARPVRRRHREGIARFYGVDVNSLTEEIAFLIDHPHTAWQMAEDGRRFVAEHYSVERMAEQYQALYNLLLDGGEAAQLNG